MTVIRRRRTESSCVRQCRRAFGALLAVAQASVLPPPLAAAAAGQRAVRIEQQAPASAAAHKPPPRVVVNKTRPRVTPPALMPAFSAQPTDQELMQARVFGEPLMLIGRTTLAEENRALAEVVRGYLAVGDREAVLPFWAFLEQFPDSPWTASLLMNLGIVYRRTGYFSRALEAWEAAWSLTKTQSDARAKPVADRTVGELVELHARLGRVDRLDTLLAEVESRPILGRATEQITAAREGLWLMRNRPDQAFRCGPWPSTRSSWRRVSLTCAGSGSCSRSRP